MENEKASYIIPFLRYALEQQETYRCEDLTMDVIDSMSGSDFETLCAYLLLCQGFTDVEQTPAVGDYGVDIIARKDGYTYAIQCKRHRNPVGGSSVQ